jgi:hypothetical protein
MYFTAQVLVAENWHLVAKLLESSHVGFKGLIEKSRRIGYGSTHCSFSQHVGVLARIFFKLRGHF